MAASINVVSLASAYVKAEASTYGALSSLGAALLSSTFDGAAVGKALVNKRKADDATLFRQECALRAYIRRATNMAKTVRLDKKAGVLSIVDNVKRNVAKPVKGASAGKVIAAKATANAKGAGLTLEIVNGNIATYLASLKGQKLAEAIKAIKAKADSMASLDAKPARKAVKVTVKAAA